ncbi:MAG: hypothetical protein WBA10_19285 [Elainellaceae cyanobacterium]
MAKAQDQPSRAIAPGTNGTTADLTAAKTAPPRSPHPRSPPD